MNQIADWMAANYARLLGGALGGAIVATVYAALGGCP